MKKLFSTICFVLLITSSVWAKDTNTVQVVTLAKSTTSWDGNTLPKYEKGQPEVTILRITIPPGVELPMHTHPVINSGVLLKGELTVITKDKKTLHLNAGDAIVEVVNTWHYGKNEGKIPAEIIVFYVGVEGEPVTIKKK